MSSVASLLGDSYTNHPLKERFLKWQCHCRQLMMRDNMGRPDNSIMPDVLIEGSDESMGAIITILNKLPGYSETPEMLHMARKTNDPAKNLLNQSTMAHNRLFNPDLPNETIVLGFEPDWAVSKEL